MPLYEYRCNDCQNTYELLRSSAERSVAAICPSCESRSSMPLISMIAANGKNYDADLPAPDTSDSSSGGGCCGGSCGCG